MKVLFIMAIREVDAISDAIIETEKEIAGAAWGNEETEALGEAGDHSLEELGGGLEGQHDADDDETEGEDADGETESDGEGEAEPAGAAEAKKPDAETEGERKPAAEQPEGRVPPGKLREANERARAAETERDALKARVEKAEADSKAQLDLVMREIAALKTAPKTEPARAEPPKPAVIPDIFENPEGFVKAIQDGFQQEIGSLNAKLAEARVETSMAIAHATHKDTFEAAFKTLTSLPHNPDSAATVQRIYRSPNPGEALVSWHKRQQTLAEVGDDPTAYRERIAKETREALMKDPEFRKALIADLRGEAVAPGPDGKTRTTTRLPPALSRATGSNLGTERFDHRASDDSDQAIAESAWR